MLIPVRFYFFRYPVVLQARLAVPAFGMMVALKQDKIIAIELTALSGQVGTVPLDSELISAGRAIGISFGD